MHRPQLTVRPITPEEVPVWWELRLRALRDHPEAYGSDYESSRQRGFDYVIERNFGPDRGINATFAAFTPDRSILGTVGVFGDTGKRSHIGVIVGVYTIPEARGRGIARRLINAAIEHCRRSPEIRQAHISVNADNAAALHLYESIGFIRWGTEPRAIALPDRFDDEIHLALMLDDGSRTR